MLHSSISVMYFLALFESLLAMSSSILIHLNSNSVKYAGIGAHGYRKDFTERPYTTSNDQSKSIEVRLHQKPRLTFATVSFSEWNKQLCDHNLCLH